MSELHRGSAALGIAASIAVAASALAQGAPKPADRAQAAQAGPEAQKAVALVSGGVAAKPDGDASCPQVIVAPEGATFPKAKDDYKATLEALARDCANLGAETIMKVSLVGEGERSSKDGPSWFAAPIKLSIKDAAGNPVETRKIRLKVQLASGELKTRFDHLEENVSLPPAEAGGYAGWSVTVGFDPSASAAARPAKAVRAATVRRAVRVARVKRGAPPAPPPRPAAAAQPSGSESPWQKIARSFTERQQAQALEKARQDQAAARARAQAPAQPPAAARPASRPAASGQQARRGEQAPPNPPPGTQARVQTNLRTAERN